MKTIKIKCKGAAQLPLELLTRFQGPLKSITDKNLEKLKRLIKRLGFIAPIFVWVDDKGTQNILDGHQRLAALFSLQSDGYEIGSIPVDFIYASSLEEAKEMLLSITSQFGEFDLLELDDWLNSVNEDLRENFRFADTMIETELKESEEQEEGEPEEKKPKCCPECGYELG